MYLFIYVNLQMMFATKVNRKQPLCYHLSLTRVRLRTSDLETPNLGGSHLMALK